MNPNLQLIICIGFFLLLFLIFGILYLKFFDKKKPFPRATFEKLKQRTLTNNERLWFQNTIRSTELHRIIGTVLISLTFITLFSGLILPSISSQAISSFQVLLSALFGFIAFTLLRNDIFSNESYPTRQTLYDQYKLDLLEPVFVVSGRVTKKTLGVERYSWRSRYTLIINDISFTYPTTHRTFAREVITGDFITIEFSPHSRHIWKEEKLEQGK